MATIHHQAYHHSTTSHHHNRCFRRHSLDYSSLPSSTAATTASSSSLRPTTLSSHLTFSLSSTSTPTPTTATANTTTAFSLETLQRHLEAQNFRQADEETRRLLIVLAGEAAVKRGYVFFSEVQFIPKDDLKAIDELWKKFSNGRFGYSVQKNIWVKVNKDFTRFFMKVGWMKKLDTEVEQYNYRAFPNEFMWELNPSTNEQEDEEAGGGGGGGNNKGIPPEGHLPLTNALRGTQLLNSILTHPAFADAADDDDDKKNGETERENEQSVSGEADKKKSRLASLRDRLFKPNYSF